MSAFNPSTQEAEVSRFLCLKLGWSTKLIYRTVRAVQKPNLEKTEKQKLKVSLARRYNLSPWWLVASLLPFPPLSLGTFIFMCIGICLHVSVSCVQGSKKPEEGIRSGTGVKMAVSCYVGSGVQRQASGAVLLTAEPLLCSQQHFLMWVQ